MISAFIVVFVSTVAFLFQASFKEGLHSCLAVKAKENFFKLVHFYRDPKTGSATTKEIRIREAREREEKSRRQRWLKHPPGIVWKSDDERRSLVLPITLFSLTVFSFLYSFSFLFLWSHSPVREVSQLSSSWQKFRLAFSFSRGIRDKYQSLRLYLSTLLAPRLFLPFCLLTLPPFSPFARRQIDSSSPQPLSR